MLIVLPLDAVDSLEAALLAPFESFELDLLFFAAALSFDLDLLSSFELERSLIEALEPLRDLSAFGTLLFSLFEPGFSPDNLHVKEELIAQFLLYFFSLPFSTLLT